MKNTEEKIKKIIEDIKPFINDDGGDIEFIKYEDNYVFVKLFGACSNCEAIDATLNDNLLMFIKEEIPEVEGIINVGL